MLASSVHDLPPPVYLNEFKGFLFLYLLAASTQYGVRRPSDNRLLTVVGGMTAYVLKELLDGVLLPRHRLAKL